MTAIRVMKLDLAGAITWQYEGRLLQRPAHAIVLEALFDKPDFPLRDVVLRTGDRFVETYYDDRRYNIFQVFDRDSRQLKGWYCNLSRPALITAGTVSWVDLALDLWVWPDGRTALLDENEFNALPLEGAERLQVLQSLDELKGRFVSRQPRA